MATTKPKKAPSKKPSTKPKAPVKSAKAEKVNKPVKAEPKKVEKEEKVAKKPAKACGIFARKYATDESILTIFKDKKVWAALIAELVGTALLSVIMFTFGVGYIQYSIFCVLAIIMFVYTLSGAHLNPIVTIGMMVTRRMSAIRGVLYIIAQVLGAWLGILLLSAFSNMGGNLTALPEMTEITNETFGMVIAIEAIGGGIIGFTFARALQYKRSALTFAFVLMGGIILAMVLGLWISGMYLNMQNVYIMNPAMALMMQIFPAAGESVGEVLGGIGLALLAYVVFPAVGGIIGFLISDVTSKLAGEKVTE